MAERTPPPDAHQPTRQYLFTEAQTRLFFIASGFGMVAALIGILILATVRPQGRFFEPDRSVHLATVVAAAERLSGNGQNPDGTVTLPIERAMALVAERGVENPFTAQVAPPAPADPDAAFDPALGGETLYAANCASCHQAAGQGIPGAFPPLAGHMPELYAAEGGRAYLINVVLYGLQGPIEVLGQPYNGVMPGFSQLADDEVAAVLNHELTSWGNDALLTDFSPITSDEVAAERVVGRLPADVLELRPELP
jgi:mono/diheme cytochrome c family protein